MADRPKVGEILVAAGIIDDMQLRAALGEQARWGRRLGVTLIKMGMVDEGHLMRALAKQLDLPVASLSGKKIAADVIALVPARVASEHGVIPLFTKQQGQNGQLFLGMEDPSNLEVLDDLRFSTGMEIHPVMVGPTELGEAIDRYYHGRTSGPPASDPFQNIDAMGHGSLRIVIDPDSQEGTAPLPIELEPQAGQTNESASEEESTIPELELSDAVSQLPEGLLDDVARAIEEAERTRVVAKALAQLLVEKGLLSIEEVQAKIAEVKAAAASDSSETDN